MATRIQLERKLKDLDAEVPELQRKFGAPDDFLSEFATKAETIAEAATTEDAFWALEQIETILAKHGYHDDFEGDIR
jgi:hypothetical protein